MQSYEIRILDDNLRTRTIVEQQCLSDHAAIRSAKRLASGHPFEVWRGLDCIFGAHADVQPALSVSRRPTA